MAKSISRYLADISSTSGVLDGTLSTAAQTNITSLGTLSSLTVSGAMNGTLSTAAQPNITSVGTLTALTVGDIVFGTQGSSTIFDASDLTIQSSGTLILNTNDGVVKLKDGGSAYAAQIDLANDDHVTISALINNKDLIFKGKDGSSTITALTLDMSEAGKATFNAGIVAGGLTYPTSDGSNGQVLKTNGSGTLSFADDSGTTINSNTNNYVITGTGTANTLQGESGLTFDGTTLAMSHAQLSHPTTHTYQTLQVLNTADTQVCLDLARSNGSKVGTFYGDSSHNQGFLSSTYGWVLKVDNSGNVMPTGYIGLGGSASPSNNCELSHPSTSTWQTLKIKNQDDSTQCAIEMHSNQDTKRCIVYGASGYYGFLTTSAGWSWKGDNSGNWTATANVTAYSDIRLKEKVITIPNALEKVTKLRGVEYTRISTQEREIGVIAQEVKEIVPELVTITDGRTEADPDALQDLHTMKYQNTVGLLIEAIKELKAEVDELKGNK